LNYSMTSRLGWRDREGLHGSVSKKKPSQRQRSEARLLVIRRCGIQDVVPVVLFNCIVARGN
jgi:hypothetical protein